LSEEKDDIETEMEEKDKEIEKLNNEKYDMEAVIEEKDQEIENYVLQIAAHVQEIKKLNGKEKVTQ
jgi:predicted  nucleic acid-binding Zn-ribbon protein